MDCYLAELLGALSGDGFIGNYGSRKQQFIIQICGDASKEMNYFLYLSEILAFHFPFATFSIRTSNNTLRLTSYSKKLFLLLHEEYGFPIGKKGNKVFIPTQIMQDPQLTNAFIRGLFDTDGCLFFDYRKSYARPYPRLTLELTSQKLFKQTVDHLSLQFKVRSSLRIRKGGFEIYSMEIYGFKHLQKWLVNIGFSNMKHIKRLCSSAVG